MTKKLETKITKNNSASYITYIILAIIVFFSLNLLVNSFFGKYELDLTKDKIFTLAEGSQNIVAKSERPVKLRLFFSNKLANGFPTLKSYASRIKGLLREYQDSSGGKISVEFIDPEPFSDTEDLAVSYGLEGVPVDESGSKLYFGLAATNDVDDVQSIPFFHFEREKFIEYDITRIVYELNVAKKPKIGLLSSINMDKEPAYTMFGGGAGWTIIDQLSQIFTIDKLDRKLTAIPKDIDVLMLVQPKNLSDATLYAIEQFVLNGGRAVVFADPKADKKINPELDEQEQVNDGFDENFNKLLNGWGVKINDQKIVLDRLAGSVPLQSKNEVTSLATFSLRDENVNKEDIITSQLKAINLSNSGVIEVIGDKSIEITPLLKTSSDSMLVDKKDASDSNKLYKNFKSDNKQYIIAARISGNMKAVFAKNSSDNNYLAKSKNKVNIIVVADSDLMQDDLWVRKVNFQGYDLLSPIADNASFVANAIDNLIGSSDLISLRGKGTAVKPFIVVEKLKKKAEAQFLSKEEHLKKQLQESESRLQQIKQQSPNANSSLYNKEQEDEIAKFSQEVISIRKELRQVQGQLRDKIEELGTYLKIINIALVPFLVILFAIIMNIYKNNLRKKYSKI